MSAPAVRPFALARTFVFRRYIGLRHYVQATKSVVDAVRRARQLRKQRKQDARLREFYGWCAGCQAYGSIF